MTTQPQVRPRTLELPEAGPGSAGGLARRCAALFIDWLSCLAVVMVLNGGPAAGDRVDPGMATMALFFAQVTLLTWLQGASFGQRILRLVVAPVGRPRVGLARVALRTALLCLVIPAAVIQPDGRGLHDLAAGTVVVRR